MIKNLECPYCNRPTTITDPNYFSHREKINIASSKKWKNIWFWFECVTCPNEKCNNLILACKLTKADYNGNYREGEIIKNWLLLPESNAKVLPDYIPLPIKEDYYEACRIKHLSPKASATLSRRCLQGMIRDFWWVTWKKNLRKEIESIKDDVDPDVWDAIDSIRKIGNIGAHMEQDINLIINVDPEEAQALIWLIELLIDERYIAKQKRQEKVRTVKEISMSKEKVKEG